MSIKTDIQNDLEYIPLLRGGGIVSSLSGAFGSSLRETRLTAMLGYLIALAPEQFLKIFRIYGTINSVSLETNHSQGRSDILIETTNGIGIIEAKTGGSNPHKQSMKYPAKWRVLITQYMPSEQEKALKNTRFIQWSVIGELLTELSKSLNPKVKFVSSDLHSYLEDYHMIKAKESVEIYAREINEPHTLVLFLKAQLYGCNYEKNSKLPEALYFAPHFGKRVAKNYPGIHVGLSYIARIETVEVLETWKQLSKTIQLIRGKSWLTKNRESLSPIHKKWDWKKNRKRSFLFLGPPRLVFNPPVKKESLQKGKGWLSKRFLSFDELFSAWEGNTINA
jgi:hypothetical protein